MAKELSILDVCEGHGCTSGPYITVFIPYKEYIAWEKSRIIDYFTQCFLY